MKIGDLIRIKKRFARGAKVDQYAIVLKGPDEFDDVVAYWTDGQIYWMQASYIEIVNEDR